MRLLQAQLPSAQPQGRRCSACSSSSHGRSRPNSRLYCHFAIAQFRSRLADACRLASAGSSHGRGRALPRAQAQAQAPSPLAQQPKKPSFVEVFRSAAPYVQSHRSSTCVVCLPSEVGAALDRDGVQVLPGPSSLKTSSLCWFTYAKELSAGHDGQAAAQSGAGRPSPAPQYVFAFLAALCSSSHVQHTGDCSNCCWC